MATNRYLDQARRMLRGTGALLVSGALVAALAMGGCSSAEAASTSVAEAGSGSSGQVQQAALSTDWHDPAETSIDISGMDLEYGDRESSGTWEADGATIITLGETVSVEGDGAAADGSMVTITAAGTYVVSGSSSDAQIAVNAGDEDKVQIVLDGASITCANGPALLVQNADKVFVTLAEGTQNSLADTADNAATLEDESLNAAVYAKDDICFNGSGALTVSGNSAHAIKGKDDVVITGGTYRITAVKDGIRGKDSVKVTGADIDITAGSDGIQASEADDPDKGFVSMDGGTVSITAGDDGVQASRYLRVTGGDITVNAGDDALHSDVDGLVSGGTLSLQAGDDAFHAEFNLGVSGGDIEVSKCVEGLEGQRVVVADGTVHIVSSDDALNAAAGGEQQAGSDDSEDAAGADAAGSAQGDAAADSGSGSAAADSGSQDDQASGERQMRGQRGPGGMGGQPPQGGMGGPQGQGQDSGSSDATPPEPPDGMEAGELPEGQPGDDAGNGQAGGFAGGMGGMDGGTMEDDGVSLIVIEGGTLTLETAGDGVDSNGDLVMTGGTLYISGPENSGNGSLDYNGQAVITGGTVLAAGSSGMAETFGSGSTQASIAVAAGGQAGDTVSVVDGSGAELVSYQVAKQFSFVIASSPEFAEGATYRVLVNGSEAASGEASTQHESAGMGVMGGFQRPEGFQQGGRFPQDGSGQGGQAPADIPSTTEDA